MKVVGISSCPCGIAHTYMAAEAMKREGKKYGIDVHIELQGQLGPEDGLSEKEIAEADAIVLCCGVLPMGAERFDDYKDKIVNVDYANILKHPQMMIDDLIEAGFLDKDIKKK